MLLRMFSLLLLISTLLPAAGMAQQQAHQRLPITTGTVTGRMDAPETDRDLEHYMHSPMVQTLARHMGISTERASRYFEDFNSGVLIAVIVFFLLRIVPKKFRAKREHLTRDLIDARQATAEAERRLDAIDQRLATLGREVDTLREQARAGTEDEQARIHAAMEEERRRIIRSAEAEIQAAQASAQRNLRRFAANLAVDRAAARVELTPENDQVLVGEFLQGLAGETGLRGRN